MRNDDQAGATEAILDISEELSIYSIPQSAFRIPRFLDALVNLPFEYCDQLLNRGRQTELLACCAQT